MILKKIINLILLPLCFVAIIFYAVFLTISVCCALFSSPLVLPYLYTSSWWFVLLIPLPIALVLLQGPLLVLYYICVLLIILLSFIWLWKKSSWEEQIPFITLAQLFLAILFFIELYYWILSAIGISYRVPPFEEWGFQWHIFLITNACLHEELVTRVLLLGVPLLLVHAVKGKTQKLRRYVLGGNFKFDFSATFFLVFSSLVFASAHIIGWDVYKVIPTFLTGLVLGYLFLKFGLYCSILLHLSCNYFGLVLGFFAHFLPVAVTALYLFLLFIGLIYFLKWGKKTLT